MGALRARSLYGTLELLILKGLDQEGPLNGVGVADHIALRSRGVFKIEEGSLYPALYRLQDKGYVVGEWRKTDEGKRAKFYELTRSGRKALQRDLENWVISTRAMMELLDLGPEEVQ